MPSDVSKPSSVPLSLPLLMPRRDFRSASRRPRTLTPLAVREDEAMTWPSTNGMAETTPSTVLMRFANASKFSIGVRRAE